PIARHPPLPDRVTLLTVGAYSPTKGFQNRVELLTLHWREITVCDGGNGHVPWAAPGTCVNDGNCDQDDSEQAGDEKFHGEVAETASSLDQHGTTQAGRHTGCAVRYWPASGRHTRADASWIPARSRDSAMSGRSVEKARPVDAAAGDTQLHVGYSA